MQSASWQRCWGLWWRSRIMKNNNWAKAQIKSFIKTHELKLVAIDNAAVSESENEDFELEGYESIEEISIATNFSLRIKDQQCSGDSAEESIATSFSSE
jgi:hypothetical protein